MCPTFWLNLSRALSEQIVRCQALLNDEASIAKKCDVYFRAADVDANGVLNQLEAMRVVIGLCKKFNLSSSKESVTTLLEQVSSNPWVGS